ncbi:MAG: hypothetical protein GF329_17580 [Candidatus Lokiarchaeota archaeon]|nr:hypothetical protein [Candidatus Lokiarchaeota archaeon]
MKIFEKILVLIDGTKRSYRVSEYGIKIAVQNESELHALYVKDEEKMNKLHIHQKQPFKEIENAYNQKANRIKTRIKELSKSYNKKVNVNIRKGKVVDEILNFIEEFNIDLICMSHKIRSGSESIRSVSVANQIIEFAQCPVFILQHK